MPPAIPVPAYVARIDRTSASGRRGFSAPLAKPNPSDAFVFGGNLLVGAVRQQSGRDGADIPASMSQSSIMPYRTSVTSTASLTGSTNGSSGCARQFEMLDARSPVCVHLIGVESGLVRSGAYFEDAFDLIPEGRQAVLSNGTD
jgi:hypothetical protein